ncbi:hypothetical protein P3L10_002185 [Capsicum annuum]
MNLLNNNHSSGMSRNCIMVSITFEQMQDSLLTIEYYDFDSNGKHDLIGKVQKSLADLEVLHSTDSGANLFIPAAMGQNSQNKVTVPSLASVYNEYALKSQFETNIYRQNLFFYGYGAIFNFLGLLGTVITKVLVITILLKIIMKCHFSIIQVVGGSCSIAYWDQCESAELSTGGYNSFGSYSDNRGIFGVQNKERNEESGEDIDLEKIFGLWINALISIVFC